MSLNLLGCKSKDPHPELSDKVYIDIRSRLEDLRKKLDNSKTFFELAELEKQAAPPGSQELAVIVKDIREEKKLINQIQQKIRYLEIRMARRKLESRISYQKAFQNDMPWPDPKEYQAYLAHQELLEAPSNWSERVPRLQTRINKYNRKMDGEDVEEEGRD